MCTNIIKYLRKYLINKVSLITPNIPEAELLTNKKIGLIGFGTGAGPFGATGGLLLTGAGRVVTTAEPDTAALRSYVI